MRTLAWTILCLALVMGLSCELLSRPHQGPKIIERWETPTLPSNAAKDLPDWQCCNYMLIQAMQIAPDGLGVMRIERTAVGKGEISELRTHDYGKHWTPE